MLNSTHKHTPKDKTKSNKEGISVLYPSPEGATYPTQGASLCMAHPSAWGIPVHGASQQCTAHPSAWRIPVPYPV
jgi:hypothetical protein